jgi:hypothetical protein
MSEKIRLLIQHEARNIFGGDITKEILDKYGFENTQYNQRQVIQLVINRIVYRLSFKKMTDCVTYWLALTWQEQFDLMQETFQHKTYII